MFIWNTSNNKIILKTMFTKLQRRITFIENIIWWIYKRTGWGTRPPLVEKGKDCVFVCKSCALIKMGHHDFHPVYLCFQPPMEEGRRRRHSSSGDGRRRHPSQPSSRPHSQASSGPSPAPAAQGLAAKDDAKPTSQRAPAADPAPDAKTLK